MTLGPADLPEDPFGPSGLSQVICACTSEEFHFILTSEGTAKAVCARCKRTGGEWPQQDQPQSPPATPLQAHAAYLDEAQPPGVPLPQPYEGDPPPLPAFSQAQCNTYLQDGPYHGQTTWLMPGTTEFVVSGVARYTPTERVHEGRIVYQHDA